MKLNIAVCASVGAFLAFSLRWKAVKAEEAKDMEIISQSVEKKVESKMSVKDYENNEISESKKDMRDAGEDEVLDNSIQEIIDNLSKKAAEQYIKAKAENGKDINENITEEEMAELSKEMAKKILEDATKEVMQDKEMKTVKKEQEVEPEEERTLILFSKDLTFTEEDMKKFSVKFELSADEEQAASLGVTMPGVYYKSEKRGEYVFDLKKEKTIPEINAVLENVLNLVKIPVFGEITKGNSHEYKNILVPIVYFVAKSADFDKYMWCQPIAEKLKNKLVIARLDYVTTEFFLNISGVSASMLPALFIISKKDNNRIYKYLLANIENNEEVAEFLENCANDLSEVKPYLMKEPRPSDEDMVNESGVVTIVNSTFDEIALNPLVDTLVVYYAEWCKFCQILIPGLDELASALREASSSIVVGKMLMSKNDVPLYDEIEPIIAYPTIRLYKKESNKEIEMEILDDPANAKSVLEFLKKHTDVSADLSIVEKAKDKDSAVPEGVKMDL